jgi:hypothetical protein
VTIHDFLLARIAEDKRRAEKFMGVWPRPRVLDDGCVALHIARGGQAVVVRYLHPVEGYVDMASLRTWAGGDEEDRDAGFGRERLLMECEAKRQIVLDHEVITVWSDGTEGAKYYTGAKRVCASCDERMPVPCRTVRLLARSFAWHPEYDKEWSL